jgi:hypothetical protein
VRGQGVMLQLRVLVPAGDAAVGDRTGGPVTFAGEWPGIFGALWQCLRHGRYPRKARRGSSMASSSGGRSAVAGTSLIRCQRVLRSGQYSRHPFRL